MPNPSCCVYVSNLSSATRSSDLKKDFEKACGAVFQVERDYRDRCAIVEFRKEDDAEYAFKKMDDKRIDGRHIKVDWATKSDFKFFGWEWKAASLSRSRSPGRSSSTHRSDSRSPSRSY